MCGRFTLRADAKKVADLFNMPDPPAQKPRYNISPSQTVLALRATADGKAKEWAMLKWGPVPSWADDPMIRRSVTGWPMPDQRP